MAPPRGGPPVRSRCSTRGHSRAMGVQGERHDRRGESLRRKTVVATDPVEEMLGEHRDIVPALAEWRQPDRDDREPMIEGFTEATLTHCCTEILVTGGGESPRPPRPPPAAQAGGGRGGGWGKGVSSGGARTFKKKK